MAGKWYLFFPRVQLLLKKVLSLFMVSILGIILALSTYKIEKVVAQNAPENFIIRLDNQQNTKAKLLNSGLKFYQEGKFNLAKKDWLQAVKEFEQQGDILNQALVLNYLSLAYQQLGEWEEAEKTIAESLKLIETEVNVNNSSQKVGALVVYARVLNTEAKLLFSLGKTEAALNNWQKVESIYTQIEDKEGVIGSKINQARALQASGHFSDSIKLLSNLKYSIVEQPEPLNINGLITLGNTLRQVGALEESLKILNESLTLAEKSKSTLAISNALISIGNTEKASANQKIQVVSAKAVDSDIKSLAKQDKERFIKFLNSYYLSAFKTYERAIEIAPAELKLQAQLNQLSMLADISQWVGKEAQKRQINIPSFLEKFTNKPEYFWTAIALPSSSQFPTQETVYARINLADSLFRIKSSSQSLNNISWQRIKDGLQKAIEQARILGDKRAESEAFGTLGSIAEVTKQWNEARTLTEKALSLSQSLRANEITYKWQWQLGRIILEADNNTQEALKVYDEALKTLELVRKDLLGVNSESQYVFRQEVEPLYRQFADLLLSDNSPSNENIKRARQVIDDLQIAEIENFLSCGLKSEKTISLDEIAKANKAAIIYPIILPQRIAVIVKLPNFDELIYYQKDQLLDYDVAIQLDGLYQDLSEEIELTEPTQSKLESLYDWLIRPAESNQKWDKNEIKTLVFVLDSKLRNIPMAALRDGQENKYLVEKYALTVNMGLKLTDPKPLQGKISPAFVAGVYTDWEKDRHLSTIANVKIEMDLIQGIIADTKELRNQDFLKDKFTQEIKQKDYSLVHLATHGQFSSNLKNTSIQAWDQPIKINDLGGIFQSRNQNRTKPIELLVLSACETAKGDERAALGIAGIAVKSGIDSILATLWLIADEATSILIPNFYRHLTDSDLPNKAEALRRAQVELIKYAENNYQSPFFWAPFILVGNWL